MFSWWKLGQDVKFRMPTKYIELTNLLHLRKIHNLLFSLVNEFIHHLNSPSNISENKVTSVFFFHKHHFIIYPTDLTDIAVTSTRLV